jgi:hypothetical protein
MTAPAPIPSSDTNLSNNQIAHLTHVTHQLETLSVTGIGKPQGNVTNTRSPIATACQEYQEEFKAACDSFSRDVRDQLAGMEQRLGASIRAYRADFVVDDPESRQRHAKFMEEMRVLQEQLDKMK